MRLDSLRPDQATVAAARQAPRRCAACDPGKGSTTAPTTTAGTTLSVTATWQWSVSMQISLRISTGAAATETPATPAPAPAVEEGHEGRHGRAHVAQSLRQLARAVRHELRAIVRDNPDMDPAVRDELRQIGKQFRDDLRAAFHDAGRGHDFDPSRLLSGVQEALLGLADRLGALIGEEEVPPTELAPPAETPPPADEPALPAQEPLTASA